MTAIKNEKSRAYFEAPAEARRRSIQQPPSAIFHENYGLFSINFVAKQGDTETNENTGR